MAKEAKLTVKQKLFVEHYCSNGFNATQAAISAGYSEKTARTIGKENITKPLIKQEISRYKKNISEQCEIDAKWLLNSAKKVYDRCMQLEPIINAKGEPVKVSTDDGDLVAGYKFDSSGANKALDIIGKHVDVQAFKEKIEVGADQELAQILIRARSRVNG